MTQPNRGSSRAWNAVALALVTAGLVSACTGKSSPTVSVPQGPAVTVVPSSANLLPGGVKQFAAVVTGLSSSAVNWSVQEGGGGTVDPTGLYSAPATEGIYHVVATSVAAPLVAGAAQVTVATLVPSGIIPDERRTTWNPGIPGGTPESVGFTVYTDATNAPGGVVPLTAGTGAAAGNRTAIQAAINGAGSAATAANPRVVQLPAGTFYVAGQIALSRDHVVLRGAGPNVGGTGGGTRLIESSAGTDMFMMGGWVDWPGAAVAVTADIPKGASTFTLAAGHGVQVGDLLTIDMLDDATVITGNGTWWKRGAGNTDNGPPSSGYRSVGQTVEVTGVSGTTITVAGIIHHAMPLSRTPQAFGNTSKRAGYAGIGLESMTITGWGNAMAVPVWNARRCWIKNVEFDGQPTAQGGVGTGAEGNDIRLYRSVRCVVEHNFLHHSRTYITDNHAYSISVAMQSSDNLIWDNIIWFKNKNLVMEASGPGNVVAYNYVEDPVINAYPPQTDWMEMGIDATHLSFPMYDLFEGNYTAKMGGADTHGGASSQTFFRNFSKGDRLYTLSANAATGAAFLQQWMHNMNVVGNVLHARSGAGLRRIYEPLVDGSGYITYQDSIAWKIWRLGFEEGNWEGPLTDPQVKATLLRTGNWDNVRNQIDATPSEALPASLFTAAKPPFFGASDWPWVDPYGATTADRVKTLPAQARFVAGSFL